AIHESSLLSPQERRKTELGIIIKEKEKKKSKILEELNIYKSKYQRLKSDIDMNEVPKQNSIEIGKELKQLQDLLVEIKSERNLLLKSIQNLSLKLEKQKSITTIDEILDLIKELEMKLYKQEELKNKIEMPIDFNEEEFNELQKHNLELRDLKSRNDTIIEQYFKGLNDIWMFFNNSKLNSNNPIEIYKLLNNFLIPIKNKCSNQQKSIKIEVIEDWNYYKNYFNFAKFALSKLNKKFNDIRILEGEIKDYNDKINEKSNKKIQEFQKMDEKYSNNLELFQQDFNKVSNDFAVITNKVKQTNDDLQKYDLNLLEEKKSEKENSIKEIKLSLNDIIIKIEKISEKLNLIKREIPSEYEDKLSLQSLIKKLNETIQEKKNEKVSLETELKMQINLDSKKVIELQTALNDFVSENIQEQINKFSKLEFNFKLISTELISEAIELLTPIKQEINEKIQKLQKKILEELELEPFSVVEEFEEEITKFLNKIEILREKIEGYNNSIEKLIESKINQKRVYKFLEENKEESYIDLLYKITSELNILEIAFEIVEEADKKLTELVLPTTRHNLARVLPILTADRYKDVDIKQDKKGRYQIMVYDSCKKEYVEKILFSGGTNDQIALAIRLAFAIAVLGQSNYEESFIFLDEPLGFFDDERKNYLIDFLTRGWIADKFAQRFVVSNFSSIKKHFDHIIELEKGKVIKVTTTGSTITIIPDDESEDKVRILNLELIKDLEDTDGYCDYIFKLKNISQNIISKIILRCNNEGVQYIPRFIHEGLKINESRQISFEFNKEIINDNILTIFADIFYFNNENYTQILKYDIYNKSMVDFNGT
ncbi:MAG: hypothetical protein ACTSRG_26760, partial [Candidatus Helarchaeota archaeon]